MRRVFVATMVLMSTHCALANENRPKVEFVRQENRVDVVVAGEPFTSYVWGDKLAKPVLVPVRTPSGIEVTRRYPVTKLEGGSHDHRHHIGIFFTVDGVNGTRFWNNVEPLPQIKHIKIEDAAPGAGEGKLSVLSHWIDESGKVLLEERRTMSFVAGRHKDECAIDFSMDLTARNTTVAFEDTEEGVFAIRLADCLREGGPKKLLQPGDPLPDESVTGTGVYFTSNGDVTAKQAWGKRARWVALQGVREGKVVGVAILNHPESINYPTYWHVRNYGLFSANPLGQGDFQRQSKYSKKNPVIPLRLTLEKGQTAHFRFLVIVYEGIRTKEDLERRFREFAE